MEKSAVFLLCVLLASPIHIVEAKKAIESEHHWAQSALDWAKKEKLVSQNIDPNKLITEAEFFHIIQKTSLYHKDQKISISKKDQKILKVGTMAQVFCQLLGISNHSTANEATQSIFNAFPSPYLLKVSARNLTYAEATYGLYFIYLHKWPLPFQIQDIQMGDPVEKLIQKLGEPDRQDQSEYGFTWYVYNKDYKKFAQFGVENGHIVGMYSNADVWNFKIPLTFYKTTQKDIQLRYGEGLKAVKNRELYVTATQNYYWEKYLLKDNYVTFFYDSHQNEKLNALLIIRKDFEERKVSRFGTIDAEKIKKFALQLFDQANAVRVIFKLPLYQWNDELAEFALQYSTKMSQQDFFDHIEPNGTTLTHRLQNSNISYTEAAENLAGGHENAFYAHNAFMTSKDGHRESILSPVFTKMGAGGYFGSGILSFYMTEYFTLPR